MAKEKNLQELSSLVSDTLEILNKAKQAGCEKVICLISSGKESVVMADLIVKSKLPVVFVTKMLVHGLSIDEDVFCVMESRYGVKIERYDHPKRLTMLESDTLRIEHVYGSGKCRDLSNPEFFDKMLMEKYGTPWLALGVRMTDGPVRALTIKKYGAVNAKLKKVYPLAFWRKGHIWKYIKENSLPRSSAYDTIHRSLDCINVKHTYPLKIKIPQDYDKIKKDFPLIDCLNWLYEKRVCERGKENVPKC